MHVKKASIRFPAENGCLGISFHVMILEIILKYRNEVLPDEKKF